MAYPVKVSILIPVYNRKNYIAECIQSALDQTITDFEIIIVDNASTDGTWEICKKYAIIDSRIRVFRNETNIGPVMNWKRCIDEARGEFGKILFSDDLIMPDYLENTLPFLENGVAFVFTAVKIGQEINNCQVFYQWHTQSNTYSSKSFIDNALWSDRVPRSPGAALFRLTDLKNNLILEISSPVPRDFLKHGAGPDVLLYLLTALNYPKVGFVSESLCFFRCHNESISIQNKNNEVIDSYKRACMWFAEIYLDLKTVSNQNTRLWLQEIQENKKWCSYKNVSEKYSFKSVELSFSSILWVLMNWAHNFVFAFMSPWQRR